MFKFKELKHYTIKHNIITSNLMKFYLRNVYRNLEMLIFVATPGRSATATLSHIFKEVDGCSSHHEPHPDMHGKVMINLNNGNDELARFYYKYIKSINIRRLAKEHKYYVETNHMFIKTFIDYVVEDFPQKVKVIHLVRDSIKVAESITRLNQSPGSKIGNTWWLDYHAPQNIIKVADVLDRDEKFNSDFYKSLWYWYEIEARVSFWRKKLSHVPFFDFNVKDINDGNKIIVLLDNLGIKYDKERILRVASTRINIRDHSKIQPPIDKDGAKKMNKKFQEMLISKGYVIPNFAL